MYLAVEGVEEAFLERNCGSDYGELYKPDSVSMGGGRGNGAGFDMDDWQQVQEQQAEDSEDLPEGFSPEEGAFPGGGMPFPGGMPGPTGEESQSDGTESETDSNSRDIPEDMGFPGRWRAAGGNDNPGRDGAAGEYGAARWHGIIFLQVVGAKRPYSIFRSRIISISLSSPLRTGGASYWTLSGASVHSAMSHRKSSYWISGISSLSR